LLFREVGKWLLRAVWEWVIN